MDKIDAGLMDSLKAIVDKITKMLDAGFKTLEKWGAESGELKETQEGWEQAITTKAGTETSILYIPIDMDSTDNIDENTLFNVVIKTPKGERSFEKVKGKDIPDTWAKVVKELLDEDPTVQASRKISVTLQRIVSSKGDKIDMTAIKANYEPNEVMTDLTALVDDDSFADQIPDTPTSYEITDEGDSFDIQQIESFSTNGCYQDMMKTAIALYIDMTALKWRSKGTNYQTLLNIIEGLYWGVKYQIDSLADWCYEDNKSVPHPLTLIPECRECYQEALHQPDVAMEILQESIRSHMGCLELYYCNLTSDRQRLVDEWIRDLRHAADNSIDRNIANEISPC